MEDKDYLKIINDKFAKITGINNYINGLSSSEMARTLYHYIKALEQATKLINELKDYKDKYELLSKKINMETMNNILGELKDLTNRKSSGILHVTNMDITNKKCSAIVTFPEIKHVVTEISIPKDK